MRKYFNPETTCLSVNAQTIICASGPSPAPAAKGQLGTMTVVQID